MPDPADLKTLPDGEELFCYKCKHRRAIKYKEMRTPSGGTYKRGWCSACLYGTKLAQTPTDAKTAPFKPGTELLLTLDVEFLHSVPGDDKSAMVIYGTRGIVVPLDALSRKEEEE
jgi:hypothetical protein